MDYQAKENLQRAGMVTNFQVRMEYSNKAHFLADTLRTADPKSQGFEAKLNGSLAYIERAMHSHADK